MMFVSLFLTYFILGSRFIHLTRTDPDLFFFITE